MNITRIVCAIALCVASFRASEALAQTKAKAKTPAIGQESSLWAAIKGADAAGFRAIIKSIKLKNSDLVGHWNLVATIDFANKQQPVALQDVQSAAQTLPVAIDRLAKPYATFEQADKALDQLSGMASYPSIQFYQTGDYEGGSNAGAIIGGGRGTKWRSLGSNVLRFEWTSTTYYEGDFLEDDEVVRTRRYSNAYAVRVGRMLLAAPTVGSQKWSVYAHNILTDDEKFVDAKIVRQLRTEAFRPRADVASAKALLLALANSDLLLEYAALSSSQQAAFQNWYAARKIKLSNSGVRFLPPQYPYLLRAKPSKNVLEIISTESGKAVGGFNGRVLEDGTMLLLPVISSHAENFPLPYIRVSKSQGRNRLSLGGAPSVAIAAFKCRKPGDSGQMGNQKSDTFQLNDAANTSIAIGVGDRVSLVASGTVKFGSFAGSGTAEGIDFGTSYNRFGSVRHGALMAAIGEDIFYIGKGNTFVSPSKGELRLFVNDSQTGDNEGAFNVEITVNKASVK